MGELKAEWTVEIDAPRERCYEVAADVPGAVEWQGTLKSVEVLESDAEGRATLVKSVSDAVVKETASTLRFSYDPPGGLSWEQEKGDLNWLVGNWVFEEVDGGAKTRATYSLHADTGRLLGMLLRGPIEAKVKEMLTKGAAEGLKEFVEAK